MAVLILRIRPESLYDEWLCPCPLALPAVLCGVVWALVVGVVELVQPPLGGVANGGKIAVAETPEEVDGRVGDAVARTDDVFVACA